MSALAFSWDLNNQSRQRWMLLAMSAAIIAGAIYLFLFDPANGAGYVPCVFRALTGFECPGCGTLRAFHQLLHGHLWAAFRLNPLTVLLIPVAAYSFVSFGLRAIRGRGLPRVFIPHRIIWLMLFVYVSFWVVRNTPMYPFRSQQTQNQSILSSLGNQ